MSVVKESNYVCANCGVAGYRIPSRLKGVKNSFCFNECKFKFYDKRIEKKCDYDGCGNIFLKRQWEVLNTNNHFCSEQCGGKFRDRKIEVACLVCNKKFMKKSSNIKTRSRHCCSRECYKILAKYHKNWGGKRSKLEIAIEEHFNIIFPFIMIEYNETKIGYELDISVPCLELAVEINGVHHYKAIHGEEELLKKQKTDREKVVKCRELGIKLFVINVSEDKNNKKIKAQRISQVEQIVRDRIIELGYVFRDVQMVLDM